VRSNDGAVMGAAPAGTALAAKKAVARSLQGVFMSNSPVDLERVRCLSTRADSRGPRWRLAMIASDACHTLE
jgi:hypothetical protein